MNNDIIYGRNPVIEALQSERTIDKIIIQDGLHHSQIGKIKALASERHISCRYVDKRRLDTICDGENHQGVVAYSAAHKYAELSDIIKSAKESDTPAFLIITDGICDPHNLGSIIRSADSAGAHGVIIPKDRNVTLNSVVAKVAAGSVEHIPVARVTNISQTIEKLKKEGIWVIGTTLDAEGYCYSSDLTVPLALVIGSEESGISQNVRKHCDFSVKLPMLGKSESLNASVAAGILMYEVVRQRLD